MVNAKWAEQLLLAYEPKIDKVEEFVIYRDVYLFRVSFIAIDESQYDPFFSVHRETGEVKDFSVLTDGDIDEIADLFEANKKGGSRG